MKIKDLIQRSQSLYSKGVQSDDSRLSDRHIYNKAITVRSRLISQESNKKQTISDWNYQTIDCVELIEVPSHNCPCIPPIGCNILKSKYKIPKPVSGIFGELIKNVTSIDRSFKIDRISVNAVNFQKGNKYTSKKINYFIQDEYLYIVASRHIKVVSITGIFEDPIEVHKFESLCGCVDCENCIDYYDLEFPIDNYLLEALIELSINELVILFSQNIEDITNNTKDSAEGQVK